MVGLYFIVIKIQSSGKLTTSPEDDNTVVEMHIRKSSVHFCSWDKITYTK